MTKTSKDAKTYETGHSIAIHANRRFRPQRHAQAEYIRLPFSPFPASLTVW